MTLLITQSGLCLCQIFLKLVSDSINDIMFFGFYLIQGFLIIGFFLSLWDLDFYFYVFDAWP